MTLLLELLDEEFKAVIQQATHIIQQEITNLFWNTWKKIQSLRKQVGNIFKRTEGKSNYKAKSTITQLKKPHWMDSMPEKKNVAKESISDIENRTIATTMWTAKEKRLEK